MKFARRSVAHPAFTLVELLVVIVIMALLMTVSARIFSNTTGNARQASRDIIKANLQQARAHAIATGNATAVVIPVLDTGRDLGARAISSYEVEKTGENFVPVRDAQGNERLLQRWETLPGNFHFISASMVSAERPTIVDSEDTLRINLQGTPVSCHFIVFSPNGQIVQPATAVHIAIAQAGNRGGEFVLTERSGGRAVFEFLEVNRLTGRTRSIQP